MSKSSQPPLCHFLLVPLCFGLSNEGAAFRHKDRFNFAVSKPEIARLKSDPLKSAEQSNVPAVYLDLLKILSVDK